MYLYPATTHTSMLLESRLKTAASKEHSWKAKRVQVCRISVRIDVRCSNQFEWTGRSPTFRQLSSLKVYSAGKDSGGTQGRHVWRRHHPRCVGLVMPILPPPAIHMKHF